VLSWVFARCAGHGAAEESPIGLMPPVGGEGIDIDGLDVSQQDMAELLRVDAEQWRAQLPQFHEHFAKFDNIPPELHAQLKALEQRLEAS
jgi:phosphoenolpyruvate carboxykinase (GTP)